MKGEHCVKSPDTAVKAARENQGTYHYTGKLEIPVGKSRGLHHSVWQASENMGSDLR